MLSWFRRYAEWLHTRWPAGTVERLPEVSEDGSSSLPGVLVTGDLTGVPLLKFALDTGARAAARVADERDARRGGGNADGETLDLVVVGGGVSGMAAAVEARRRGLAFRLYEASEPFSTLVNFPTAKPIFTYPGALQPAGALQVRADVKEALLDELRRQVREAGIAWEAGRVERLERGHGHLVAHLEGGGRVRARRAIVAIGKSGNFRRLGVPGEDLPHVYNRLHDPADFAGRRVLVVGSGDTAVETTIALARAGATVDLAVRGEMLSRPKAANLEMLHRLLADPRARVAVEHPSSERVTTASGPFQGPGAEPGRVRLRLATRVREIREGEVVLAGRGGETETLRSDAVFSMVGRLAPLEFFRRSGIRIAGEMTAKRWAALSLFLLFCAWLHDWKSGGRFHRLWEERGWFPFNLPDLLRAAGERVAALAADPSTLLGTLAVSAASPAFWYTVAYSVLVVWFGVRRIRRRRTPYVTVQTLTLMAIQVGPLFLLPEIVLPLLHHNGLLSGPVIDGLFPAVDYGHGREFWRAYGLILAWPLNVYNLFTHEPLWWWIGIGAVQTLVLIPLGITFFGKGAYCGWICSCGALAETLGDAHRHKMPHGPGWNRLNLAGQAILLVAVVLLGVRVAGWVLPPGNGAAGVFDRLLQSYKWGVDVLLAGILGYGLYFWFSGRVWCRFFCPLAALMHLYARASRFRILSDKKKCISCNVCTSVCHQGIDVMNFANKGLPMADPQCVRCSACVEACPTGVLAFGQVDRQGRVVALDRLPASPVRLAEREPGPAGHPSGSAPA